jgi:hypothetical protein
VDIGPAALYRFRYSGAPFSDARHEFVDIKGSPTGGLDDVPAPGDGLGDGVLALGVAHPGGGIVADLDEAAGPARRNVDA